MKKLKLLPVILCIIFHVNAKFHHLNLRADSRRNIVISDFEYGTNGTVDISISHFTVPDKIKDSVDSTENADKLGVIGFSLSRGSEITRGVGSNPHVCQLQQTDQGFDAIFFFADLPNKRLRIYRSGIGKYIKLCANSFECSLSNSIRIPKPEELQKEKTKPTFENQGWFRNIFGRFLSPGSEQIAYENYIPLTVDNGNQFSTNISIRFEGKIKGEYVFMFHNCYNYRAHGYSDRVAVDLTIDMVEKNKNSYLSLSDIPKPQILLYISILFFGLAIYWSHLICRSDPQNIYRVHKLMTVLVYLKSLSLFFHGLNYYYLSKYGIQKEFWALLFYITHLMKGLILFGTIILIGSGYAFIKQFLTDRDRRIFMTVLPIQVLDNIFMIILNESELGTESHQLWLKLFFFLDILCCLLVGLPIVWSIQHLYEGATTDGKSAANLNKLRLFRQYYIIVISYVYTTRLFSIVLKSFLPSGYEWIVVLLVEMSTFFFFILVGYKFRPANNYNYFLLNNEFDGGFLEKDDDDKSENDQQFLKNAYSENNVSRRIVAEDNNEVSHNSGTVQVIE